MLIWKNYVHLVLYFIQMFQFANIIFFECLSMSGVLCSCRAGYVQHASCSIGITSSSQSWLCTRGKSYQSWSTWGLGLWWLFFIETQKHVIWHQRVYDCALWVRLFFTSFMPTLILFLCQRLHFYTPRFVRGTKPGRDGGFDISEADLTEMEQPRDIIVASAIFGKFQYHRVKLA